MRKQCKKKIFAQGNHEIWFDKFVEEKPYLTQYLSRTALKCDERGYEWHKYGKVFKVHGSKLYAYHGEHLMDMKEARTHALKRGGNNICDHNTDCNTT